MRFWRSWGPSPARRSAGRPWWLVVVESQDGLCRSQLTLATLDAELRSIQAIETPPAGSKLRPTLSAGGGGLANQGQAIPQGQPRPAKGTDHQHGTYRQFVSRQPCRVKVGAGRVGCNRNSSRPARPHHQLPTKPQTTKPPNRYPETQNPQPKSDSGNLNEHLSKNPRILTRPNPRYFPRQSAR
jgi:hypothetical protein